MIKKAYVFLTEDMVRSTAALLGPYSAAAAAIAKADKIRETGKEVEFFRAGRQLHVRSCDVVGEAVAG